MRCKNIIRFINIVLIVSLLSQSVLWANYGINSSKLPDSLKKQCLAPGTQLPYAEMNTPFVESIYDKHATLTDEEDAIYYPFDELINSIKNQVLEEYDEINPDESPEFKPIYDEAKDVLDEILVAAKLNPQRFKLYILNSNQINAFVIPYAKEVYVTTGILKALAEMDKGKISKRKLAALFAHEIQHLRQFREKVEKGEHWKDYDLIVELKDKDIKYDEILSILFDRYAKEYDADHYIPELLEIAGYSVLGGIELFESFINLEKQSKFRRLVSYLDIHPTSPQRLDEIKKIIRAQSWTNFHEEDKFFSKQALKILKVYIEPYHLLMGKFLFRPNSKKLITLIKNTKSISQLLFLIQVPFYLFVRKNLKSINLEKITYQDIINEFSNKLKTFSDESNNLLHKKVGLRLIENILKKYQIDDVNIDNPPLNKNISVREIIELLTQKNCKKIKYFGTYLYVISDFFKNYLIIGKLTYLLFLAIIFVLPAIVLYFILPSLLGIFFITFINFILFYFLGKLKDNNISLLSSSMESNYYKEVSFLLQSVDWDEISYDSGINLLKTLTESTAKLEKSLEKHQKERKKENTFDTGNKFKLSSESFRQEFDIKELENIVNNYKKYSDKLFKSLINKQVFINLPDNINLNSREIIYSDRVFNKERAQRLIKSAFKDKPDEFNVFFKLLIFKLKNSKIEYTEQSIIQGLIIEDFHGSRKKIQEMCAYSKTLREKIGLNESQELLKELLSGTQSLDQMFEIIHVLFPNLELNDFVDKSRHGSSLLETLISIYQEKTDDKKVAIFEIFENFFELYYKYYDKEPSPVTEDKVSKYFFDKICSYRDYRYTGLNPLNRVFNKINFILNELNIDTNISANNIRPETRLLIYFFYFAGALDYKTFKSKIINDLNYGQISYEEISLLNQVFIKLTERKSKIYLTTSGINKGEVSDSFQERSLDDSSSAKKEKETKWENSKAQNIEKLLDIQTWEEYGLFLGQISLLKKLKLEKGQIQNIEKGFFDNEDEISSAFFGEIGIGRAQSISDEAYDKLMDELYRNVISYFLLKDVKSFSRLDFVDVRPHEIIKYFYFLNNNDLTFEALRDLIKSTLPDSVYKNYAFYFCFLFKGLPTDKLTIRQLKIVSEMNFTFKGSDKSLNPEEFLDPLKIKELINSFEEHEKEKIYNNIRSIFPFLSEDRRLEALNQISFAQVMEIFEAERSQKSRLSFGSLVVSLLMIHSGYLYFFGKVLFLGILASGVLYFIGAIFLLIILSLFSEKIQNLFNSKPKVIFLLSVLSVIFIFKFGFFAFFGGFLIILFKVLFPYYIITFFAAIIGLSIVSQTIGLNIPLASSFFYNFLTRIEWPVGFRPLYYLLMSLANPYFKKDSAKNKFLSEIGKISGKFLAIIILFPAYMIYIMDYKFKINKLNHFLEDINKKKNQLMKGEEIDKEKLIQWIIDKNILTVDFIDYLLDKHSDKSDSPSEKTKIQFDREAAKSKRNDQLKKVLNSKSTFKILTYVEKRILVRKNFLQKNFWLLKRSNQKKQEEKIEADHQKYSHNYSDLQNHRAGGVNSFIDSTLRMIIPKEKDDILNPDFSKISLDDYLTEIKSDYPGKSPRRDAVLSILLNEVQNRIKANNLSQVEFNDISSLLEKLKPLFYHKYSGLEVRYAALETGILLNSEIMNNIQDELNLIKKHFPDQTYFRDDILNQTMEKAKTPEEAQQINDLILSNKANIMHEENARQVFLNDKALVWLQNLNGDKKLELMLWLLDVEKSPPLFIKEVENYLEINFSFLKDIISKKPYGNYLNVGATARYFFLNAMFFGVGGIFNKTSRKKIFLKSMFDHFIPKETEARDTLEKIFYISFDRFDEDHQSQILFGVLEQLKNQIKSTDKEQSQYAGYEAVRAYLSITLIGTKLGQILGFSDLIKIIELRNVLRSLSSQKKGGFIFIFFNQLVKIFGFFPFEFKEDLLGEGGVGAVFKVKELTGNKSVVKMKKPSVNQLLKDELKFFKLILEDLQKQGVKVPKALYPQVEKAVIGEVNFKQEMLNSFRFKKRVEARWKDNEEFSFEVLTPNDERQNVYLKWDAIGDQIPINRLRTEAEIRSDLVNKLKNKGYSDEKIEEIILGEIEAIRKIFSISDDNFDDEVKNVRAKLFQGCFKELVSEVFEDAQYHADPHGGNILASRDENGKFHVLMIDWGQISQIRTNRDKWAVLFWLLKTQVVKDYIAKIPVVRSVIKTSLPLEHAVVATFFAKISYLIDEFKNQNLNNGNSILDIIIEKTHIDKTFIWNFPVIEKLPKVLRLALSSVLLRIFTLITPKKLLPQTIENDRLTKEQEIELNVQELVEDFLNILKDKKGHDLIRVEFYNMVYDTINNKPDTVIDEQFKPDNLQLYSMIMKFISESKLNVDESSKLILAKNVYNILSNPNEHLTNKYPGNNISRIILYKEFANAA
ncbi:MAG: peptidase M48 Ste24p [uncultured bacterium]|nr:MAG: peptidase M48 Ste24p [uncultured bacterium]